MIGNNTNQTTGAALEFHVHDLEEAISYYGEEVAAQVVEGLGRTAHLQIDGEKIILRECSADADDVSTGRSAMTG